MLLVAEQNIKQNEKMIDGWMDSFGYKQRTK